jgi:hypothetical protein
VFRDFSLSCKNSIALPQWFLTVFAGTPECWEFRRKYSAFTDFNINTKREAPFEIPSQ